MMPVQPAPAGFDIDPATGMPKLRAARKSATQDPGGLGVSDPFTGTATTPAPASTAVSSPLAAVPRNPTTTATGPPVAPAPTTPPAISTINSPTPSGGIQGVPQAGLRQSSSDLQALSAFLVPNASNPQQAINQFNASHPGSSLAPSWNPDSKTIGLGNGTYLVAPGTGGNQSNQWQVVQRGPETNTNAITNTQTIPVAPVTSVTNNLDPWLHDQISSLLTSAEQPVTANDPTIKAQTDAANVAGQRQLSEARNAAAERAAAEGLPTASVDAAITGNQEKFGENMASMTAGLMQTELQNRRAQVAQMLQLATGQDAQNLTAQLKNLDAAIAEQGMGVQNQQFYDNLSSTIGLDQMALNEWIQSQLMAA